MSDDLVATLVTIWRAALKNDVLDAESDFVEFGGTSLTAVRIQAMIRSELGKDVDLLDILDNPTPTELAPAVTVAPEWTGSGPEPGQDERVEVRVDSGTAVLVRDPDRPRAYTLLLDGVPQSHVDLDDPTRLEFDYMRRIAHVVDAGRPRQTEIDILHLGGGGLTLPRYFAATRVARQYVAEADGALVDLVRRELPLPSAARVDVRVGDARAVLTDTRDGRYDVIIADVYTALAIPAHVLAVEFVEEAARVLRPGGQYVANIADGGPLTTVRSQLTSLRTVFPYVCLLAHDETLRGRRSGNVVLAASDTPLPVDPLLRHLTGDPSPCRLVDGPDLDTFAAGSPDVSEVPEVMVWPEAASRTPRW
ncbi:fused MFS/spermidine synthase [Micromonospora sp. CPCC 206061]